MTANPCRVLELSAPSLVEYLQLQLTFTETQQSLTYCMSAQQKQIGIFTNT